MEIKPPSHLYTALRFCVGVMVESFWLSLIIRTALFFFCAALMIYRKARAPKIPLLPPPATHKSDQTEPGRCSLSLPLGLITAHFIWKINKKSQSVLKLGFSILGWRVVLVAALRTRVNTRRGLIEVWRSCVFEYKVSGRLGPFKVSIK